MGYVVTQRKKNSGDRLVPFSKEDLDGKYPEGFPDKGSYWIVSGTLVKKETGPSGEIHADIKDKKNSRISVRFNPDNPNFQKISIIQQDARITLLMNDKAPADLRLGPYFGYVTWIFLDKELEHSALEVSVS